MNLTYTGTVWISCAWKCGERDYVLVEDVPTEDLEAHVRDTMIERRWYAGTVCPACTPDAAACESANDEI